MCDLNKLFNSSSALVEVLELLDFGVEYDDAGNISGLSYDDKSGVRGNFSQCIEARYRGRVLSRVGRRGRRGLGNGFLVCREKGVQIARTEGEIHFVSITLDLLLALIER